MAGNCTELILSLISKAIRDVDTGMSKSCGNIDDALLMRVNDLKNRHDHHRAVDIDLGNLRKRSTPLLDDVDKDFTNKKRYADLVVLNITAHYGYACVALNKLLQSVKEVIVDNYNDDKRADVVIKFRPHTLGAIKPPEPADIINGIKKRLADLKIQHPPEAATVSAAIKAISNETEAFRRENTINNAFDMTLPQDDLDKNSRVVKLSGDMTKVLRDILNDQWTTKGPDTIISSFVSQRPAEFGVEWRPNKYDEGVPWRFPVANLWGDNTITVKTLATLLTRSIIPNIELSFFLLCMSNHIRCVIRSAKEILFSGENVNNSIFFEDETYANWCVWLNLYNKLEWFILVSRYFIFLHSKKERFTENGQGCTSTLLAAAAESIPPYLMVKEWVEKNLFNWPEKGGVNETLSIELLLSFAVRTSPGAAHPVFEVVNEGEYALTNRLNIDSATFCIKILLGRALDEEDAGTILLVMAADKQIKSVSNKSIPLGILPATEISISPTLSHNNDNEAKCNGGGVSPFLSHPTYCMRKIWNMEIDADNDTFLKLENKTITSAVLTNMSPLLFEGGMAEVGKEWASLKMLDCCQAAVTIDRVWTLILGDSVAKAKNQAEVMARNLCDKQRFRKKLKLKASLDIGNFLSSTIADIQESNNQCSLLTENALWVTSVWEKTITAVLTHLSSFPDSKIK